MKRLIFTAILLIVFFTHDISFASTRIAVLDFELNDITSLPNVPQEIKRTASYDIELKGNHEKVTECGVSSLAKKINESLNTL